MKVEVHESQGQLLAWELKAAAWSEVAHLPLAEALRERTRISNETVKRLGLTHLIRTPRASTGQGSTPENGKESGKD